MDTGKRYSEEFKASVIRRIQLGEITKSEASRQYGMALTTLSDWLRKVKGNIIDRSSTTEGTSMKTITLPKGITYLDAYGAVAAKELLNEVEFGKFCRKKGITTDQVEQWRVWFSKHPNAVASELYTQSQQSLQALQKQNQSLEKKIQRKDKALAQSAEMLLLSKKAQAILAGEDN